MKYSVLPLGPAAVQKVIKWLCLPQLHFGSCQKVQCMLVTQLRQGHEQRYWTMETLLDLLENLAHQKHLTRTS